MNICDTEGHDTERKVLLNLV